MCRRPLTKALLVILHSGGCLDFLMLSEGKILQKRQTRQISV